MVDVNNRMTRLLKNSKQWYLWVTIVAEIVIFLLINFLL